MFVSDPNRTSFLVLGHADVVMLAAPLGLGQGSSNILKVSLSTWLLVRHDVLLSYCIQI